MSETTRPQPPMTSSTDDGRPGAAAPRRLTRRSSDRMLGGVAGGVADYLGVDPVLARLAFVALAFLNLLGVLAYLVAWVVVPADDAAAAPLEQAVDAAAPNAGGRRVVGIVLLVLGGLLVLGPLTQGSTLLSWWGGGLLSPGLTWAAVLIAVGVLLYRLGDPGRPQPGGPPPHASAARAAEVPPPPSTATAPPTRGDAMSPPGATTPPTAAGADDPPPGPPSPPLAEGHDGAGGHAGPPAPERSALGRLTLAAALVAVGVAALLDAAGLLALGGVELLAVALLVIGAGLLVGTVAGRARWLIAVGLALLPVIAAVGVVETVAARDLPLVGVDGVRVGERVLAPGDLAELDDAYRLTAGSLVVDLSGLEATPEDATLDLAVGAGEIEVLLPPEVTVKITASAGVGSVTLPSRDADGFDVDLDERWRGEADADELRLDARVGAGEITVTAPEPTQGGRR